MSTLSRTFSTSPVGYLIDISANIKEIVVDTITLPNFFVSEYDIKLILASRSHKAFNGNIYACKMSWTLMQNIKLVSFNICNYVIIING